MAEVYRAGIETVGTGQSEASCPEVSGWYYRRLDNNAGLRAELLGTRRVAERVQDNVGED